MWAGAEELSCLHKTVKPNHHSSLLDEIKNHYCPVKGGWGVWGETSVFNLNENNSSTSKWAQLTQTECICTLNIKLEILLLFRRT